jgi:thioredoxin reductase (NADPH)
VFDILAIGFFVAIGHQPNAEIFKGYIALMRLVNIVNTPGTSKTNVDVVFVAGDAAYHV